MLTKITYRTVIPFYIVNNYIEKNKYWIPSDVDLKKHKGDKLKWRKNGKYLDYESIEDDIKISDITKELLGLGYLKEVDRQEGTV